MKNKSGIPPYDAGVFFILYGNDGKHWPPRDVGTVSGEAAFGRDAKMRSTRFFFFRAP